MEDKEVGELWRKYRPWSGLHGIELQAAKDNTALIRKLVEERRRNISAAAVIHRDQKRFDDAEKIALEGFGIDSLD